MRQPEIAAGTLVRVKPNVYSKITAEHSCLWVVRSILKGHSEYGNLYRCVALAGTEYLLLWRREFYLPEDKEQDDG